MKAEFYTESNSIVVQKKRNGAVTIDLSGNAEKESCRCLATFEKEDVPSLAEFLRETSEKVEKIKSL